jgi:hypothetical protein
VIIPPAFAFDAAPHITAAARIVFLKSISLCYALNTEMNSILLIAVAKVLIFFGSSIFLFRFSSSFNFFLPLIISQVIELILVKLA